MEGVWVAPADMGRFQGGGGYCKHWSCTIVVYDYIIQVVKETVDKELGKTNVSAKESEIEEIDLTTNQADPLIISDSESSASSQTKRQAGFSSKIN